MLLVYQDYLMCMLLRLLGQLGDSHGNDINMCNQDTGITGIYNISEQDTGITGICNKYNMRVLLP